MVHGNWKTTFVNIVIQKLYKHLMYLKSGRSINMRKFRKYYVVGAKREYITDLTVDCQIQRACQTGLCLLSSPVYQNDRTLSHPNGDSNRLSYRVGACLFAANLSTVALTSSRPLLYRGQGGMLSFF